MATSSATATAVTATATDERLKQRARLCAAQRVRELLALLSDDALLTGGGGQLIDELAGQWRLGYAAAVEDGHGRTVR